MKIFLLCLFICSIFGCKTLQVSPQSSVSQTSEAQPEVAVRILSWEKGSPNRKAWSNALMASVAEKFNSFSLAQDNDKLCAKYSVLSPDQKIDLWSEMIVTMATFESSWNPSSAYQEPMPPKGPGTLSQGLLQISVSDKAYGGACSAITKSSLYEPITNISCSVQIMARLIERDHVLQNSHNLGLARYWSVIRDGHKIKQITAATNKLPFCN
jgi:hypothetical protein